MIPKARTDLYTARDLQQIYVLDIGVRRVQRILYAAAHLVYSKMLVALLLTPEHKRAHMEWCSETETM